MLERSGVICPQNPISRARSYKAWLFSAAVHGETQCWTRFNVSSLYCMAVPPGSSLKRVQKTGSPVEEGGGSH